MAKREKTFDDNFEELYLRHDLAGRIAEMDGSYIREYRGIIWNTTEIIYQQNHNVMRIVGFEMEDLISISNMYAIYYMSLYSLRHNEKAMEKFLMKYKIKHGKDAHPPKEEVNRVERNNLINFLRQKLYHCCLVFVRKGRNILGGSHVKIYLAETDKSKKVDIYMAAKEPKKYGFRVVTQNEFKEIKKKPKGEYGEMFDDKGFKVHIYEEMPRSLTVEEHEEAFMSRNIYYEDPEIACSFLQKEVEFEALERKFQNFDKKSKRKMLNKFIYDHATNDTLKEEVKIARRLLKDMRNVV